MKHKGNRKLYCHKGCGEIYISRELNYKVSLCEKQHELLQPHYKRDGVTDLNVHLSGGHSMTDLHLLPRIIVTHNLVRTTIMQTAPSTHL